MKTRDEVEQLKRQWSQDPIWDIEDTEGFEDYREELRAYREEKWQEWRESFTPRKQVKTLVQSLDRPNIEAADQALEQHLNDGWELWSKKVFQRKDGTFVWYERVVLLVKEKN